MLTPETRYDIWEDLRDQIQKLFSHIEDILDTVYAPYGRSKDVDTPYVQKLFKTLDTLNDFACEHLEELNQQWTEWAELQEEKELDDMLDDSLHWSYGVMQEMGDVLVA